MTDIKKTVEPTKVEPIKDEKLGDNTPQPGSVTESEFSAPEKPLEAPKTSLEAPVTSTSGTGTPDELVNAPTGDEITPPDAPLLKNVDAVKDEVNRAAAEGRAPDLGSFRPVDVAAAGIAVIPQVPVSE